MIDVSHSFVSRGIAFEPQWVTNTPLPGHWVVSTSLSALFGDTKLGNTFYGIAPGEATVTHNSYTAKSGLIALRAGAFASYMVSPDVRLLYTFRIESLAGAVNRDSPLVRRNVGWGAGIGLLWTLARSAQNTDE